MRLKAMCVVAAGLQVQRKALTSANQHGPSSEPHNKPPSLLVLG